MKTKLIPFTKDMISEAGALLARRHQRNRKTLPFLTGRFEKKEISEKAINLLFEKKNSSGYAAIRNGKMVAYFLGRMTIQPWGRCGWVSLPGSALAEGESVETLQDLYVLLGDDWVKRGVFIHHTYLSVADKDLINAWFNLDFGKERIDAILDLKQIEIPDIKVPSGIQIRRAKDGDNQHLASMSHLIMRELEKAPYWHPTPPEDFSELREGWAELASDETVNTWLAFEGGKAIGTIASWETMHPEGETDIDMHTAENTFSLSVAATTPEARGRGIMTALTWTCLEHNLNQGFKYCFTDWISPNLAASRFWPRFGYKEVSYRLTKNINPMISWTRKAQGKASCDKE
ncbi:MAG: GNAT family N-acetyltransferase [Anaerolineae bacterium]|nr:GNAT family N-acetyltransferase [Anaerolineae bacterium]